MYTDSASTLDQPVEAYWQQPAGKTVLTFGKFYVPFAQQEWQYESKLGMMAQWTGGRSSLAMSVNRNANLDSTNGYVSGSYKVAGDAEVGLSFGLGNGFSFDSIHDRGVAIDTNIGYAGWRLYGEYNHFSTRGSYNDFDYISGKLYYEKLGVWKPFVAAYSWDDHSGGFGSFKSTLCGVDYQASPKLGIEAAIATTSGKAVSWLQLHWTWEKTISR